MNSPAQYVDISAFQPTAIDWNAYKAWSALGDGISRVALRSSYGTGFVDQHYLAYRQGALAAGIDVIIHYHYAYPSLNSAVSEAAWQQSVVGAIRPHDVLMLDFEENTAQATAQWAYDWLIAQMNNYGGILPTLYAGDAYIRQRLQDARLATYPLTLANWQFDPASRPPCPAPWTQYTYLQYTDRAINIPGIAGTVDVNVFLGGASMPILSQSGCVLDLVKSYQLDGGSQDKCGPWSVAELKYAGLPGHGATVTAAQVQAWASAEYTKWIGTDVVSNQNGSSIDNMHEFLHDAGLHWFDISAINPTSVQSSDIANLHKALDAGYPVVVTVNEQSVIRRNGTNPYPWQPRLGPVNHVFTIVGHTGDGYLLVDDELNQGDAWPDQYSEAAIECHWASIVQVVGPNPTKPWLAPIPDPTTTWPAGFTAQLFAVPLPPLPPPHVVPPPIVPPPPPKGSFMEQQMQDTWNAFFNQLILFVQMLNLPLPVGASNLAPPPYNTGIAALWRSLYGAHNLGTPLGLEYDTVNWQGVPMKIQLFAAGRIEWTNGLGAAWNAAGQKIA